MSNICSTNNKRQIELLEFCLLLLFFCFVAFFVLLYIAHEILFNAKVLPPPLACYNCSRDCIMSMLLCLQVYHVIIFLSYIDLPKMGVKQRSNIGTSRGLLLDLLTHLCGRVSPGIPLNLPPCTTASERVNQQYSTYDSVISFLR